MEPVQHGARSVVSTSLVARLMAALAAVWQCVLMFLPWHPPPAPAPDPSPILPAPAGQAIPAAQPGASTLRQRHVVGMADIRRDEAEATPLDRNEFWNGNSTAFGAAPDEQ